MPVEKTWQPANVRRFLVGHRGDGGWRGVATTTSSVTVTAAERSLSTWPTCARQTKK